MRAFAAVAICLCLVVSTLAQERIPRADRAKMRETRETMRALHLDLTTYHQINGNYPEDLKALVDNQLREAVPKDAWGKEFAYTVDSGKFKLTSWGSDGKPGGKGGEADIIWNEKGEHRELSADEKAERERIQAEQRHQATRLLARKRMTVVAARVVDYRREQSRWPAKLDDCKPETDAVIAVCFNDPFGHEFALKLLPKENFAIVCYGADGEEDGAGHDADFVVTEREVRREYETWRDYWGYNPYNSDWRVENLANDVTRFKERFGRLPEELSELTRGGRGPDGEPLPPIRNSIPQDAWGNEFVLIKLNEEEFYIAGLGKDQLEGGVKDDVDVIYPEPGRVQEDDFEDWEEPMPAQNDDEILYEVAQELALDIVSKVNEHHAETGNYPESLDDIAGKFPEEVVPSDPWESAFIYALTKDADGKVTGFTVTCFGSDRVSGGESWAADIVFNQDSEPVVAEDE